MTMVSQRWGQIALCLAALGGAGCAGRQAQPDTGPAPTDAGSEQPDAGDTPGEGPVTIRFDHLVDGAPVDFTTTDTPYTSAAGNPYNLSRLMYFVTDVTVTMADDSTIVAAGPHYLDHEDDASRSYRIADEAAPGDVKSISFTMGIPAAQNTSGRFPNAPESLMEWPDSMGGGYHYMKLEGRYLDTNGQPANLRAHAGPTDGNDNSFAVTLDATGRSIGADGATFTVDMNLEQWFRDPNTLDFNTFFTSEGIMGDQTRQTQLRENGADVFTLGDG
jgi:hypothetical protein